MADVLHKDVYHVQRHERRIVLVTLVTYLEKEAGWPFLQYIDQVMSGRIVDFEVKKS